MLKEVTLPGIAENIDSGEVIAVLVSVGDVVEKDQPVVELETEKAAFEVPAPERGRVAEIDVKPGQTVKVGAVLVKLQTEGELVPGPKPRERPAEPPVIAEVVEEPAIPLPPEEVEPSPVAQPPSAGAPAVHGRETRITPEGGGATREEKMQALAEPERPASAVPVAAAPSVRQLARELGIDIAEVPGSGSGGRITPEDVKQYAHWLISGGAVPVRALGGAPMRESRQPLPDLAQWGDIERQPMSKTRRTIADTLSYAWTHIPHVTQYDRADITDLESFRKDHAPQVEKAGGKLTVTSIVVKIVASALRAFPQFNASLDEQRQEIVYRKYCHIAVAVDTERGLLVPVIRDADRKSIVQISVELAQLAAEARNKQITPDELMGGGFTVSNLGGLGGTNFSPVIYWPQVAILGISRSTWETTPREGAIREKLMLPLSLSYDHRLIDGAEGVRFLHWIVQALEQPLVMML
jgi:pyruvate dehydrogenase E2 component (dihydrolipoamide acetyltransferase)